MPPESTFMRLLSAIAGPQRADTWANLMTGIGSALRDKRRHNVFDLGVLVDDTTAEHLWRTDDIGARVVEVLPYHMTRAGFDIRLKPGKRYGSQARATAGVGAEEGAEGEDLEQEEEREAAPAPGKVPARPGERPREDRFPPFGGGKGGSPKGPGGAPFGKGGPPPFGLGPPPKPKPKPVEPIDEESRELTEMLHAAWDELGASAAYRRALEYRRAYGGGAVLVGVDDGLDPKLPVDESKIKAVRWLTVLRASECPASRYYADPRKPKYGEPELYRLQPVVMSTGTEAPASQLPFEVHESRVIPFCGVWVSPNHRQERQGWGDSTFTRVFATLSDFGMSWGSVGLLVQDYSQAIWKVKGLSEIIASNSSDKVKKRIEAMDMSRSVARAMIMDADNEEFSRNTSSFTGLPEVMDRFAQRLAAALEMPVDLLMGTAPAGLNNTGNSTMRFWYDTVDARRAEARPQYETLIRYLMLAREGDFKGKEPDNWCVQERPLWQPTEDEKVKTRNTQAQSDKIYVDAGVLTPEEVAASRFGGGAYSIETTLDVEGRKAMAEEDEAAPELGPDGKPIPPDDDPAADPDDLDPEDTPVPGGFPPKSGGA